MTREEKELALRERFRELTPTLLKWGKFVDKELKKIITISGFKEFVYIWPKLNVKDENSFVGKALYREKEYSDPLPMITDKVRTRVVLLSTDHILLLQNELIKKKCWDIRIDRDIWQQNKEKPKEFDYQAQHLIVKPSASNSIYSLKEKDLLCCEIQIKTLLQHAFAEVSHNTIYKGAFKYDSSLIRDLSKSMALLESTDDYFTYVLKRMSNNDFKALAFFEELVKIYESLNPAFNKKDIDLEFTKMVFDMVDIDDLDISQIEMFVNGQKEALKVIFEDQKFFLSKQPIFILLAYFIKKKRRYINDKWDAPQDILDSVKRKMGYSASY